MANDDDDRIGGVFDDGEPERDPEEEAALEQHGQVERALRQTDNVRSSTIRLPFAALDRLCAPLTPGSLWYWVAFSGNGKTTLLMSISDGLRRQGIPVWYVGLETSPEDLRKVWAARQAGVHPGDALTGQLSDAEHQRWQDMLHKQHAIDDLAMRLLRFSPTRAITTATLWSEADRAAAAGSRVMVIDHIDHIDVAPGSGGGGAIGDTRAVNHTLLKVAQRYPAMVYLIASQANNEALRGDPLGLHLPVQPHHVWMGSVKRQVATGMVGIYKPLAMPPSDPEQVAAYEAAVKAVRSRHPHPPNIAAPHTMGFNLMKHRYYGEREGQTDKLWIGRGAIRDWISMDEANARLRIWTP